MAKQSSQQQQQLPSASAPATELTESQPCDTATLTHNECHYEDTRYFTALAAAFVRGKLPTETAGMTVAAAIAFGQTQGLRLHKFKRQTELPRVRKVLVVG